MSVPYLRSEYGKDYDFDAPVKLLDSMMHAMADKPDQQVVVLCQVSQDKLSACMLAGHSALLAQSVQPGQGCPCTMGCQVSGHAARHG